MGELLSGSHLVCFLKQMLSDQARALVSLLPAFPATMHLQTVSQNNPSLHELLLSAIVTAMRKRRETQHNVQGEVSC